MKYMNYMISVHNNTNYLKKAPESHYPQFSIAIPRFRDLDTDHFNRHSYTHHYGIKCSGYYNVTTPTGRLAMVGL